MIIREPREGLPVFGAKKVPSFLSYFKTLSIVPASGVEPATSRSAVKRSTDCANPAVDKLHFAHEFWAYLYKFANLNTQDIGKLYILFGCFTRIALNVKVNIPRAAFASLRLRWVAVYFYFNTSKEPNLGARVKWRWVS